MTEVLMPDKALLDPLKQDFLSYLKPKRKPDLITSYLHYVALRDKISPVVCPRYKLIFKSLEDSISTLEKEGRIWRETRIHVGLESAVVNEQTKKIYICPFSGKVFADNTHPNPQDAIYDWVARCPQNTERKDGLVVKRFFVSEDPEIIKTYIDQSNVPVVKVVFSSALTGALYQNKETILKEFKKDYVKPFPLDEIQNQNRFEIESGLLQYIQEQLAEDRVSEFIESLSQYEEFTPYIEKWLEG